MMQLKTLLRMSVLFIILVMAATCSSQTIKTDAMGQGSNASWAPVERAMGINGTLQPGDVMKFSMPRSDLNITVGSVRVAPGLALGSWVAFKSADSGAMVMGDLVLTESEVGPVMYRLERGGINITALHNHLLGESPHVMYMHISGHGDPVAMAEAIHGALTLTGTPLADPAATKPVPAGLNATELDNIMGLKGKFSGGVYQYSVPRAEKIMDEGMEIPPSMGVAMPINFQQTGSKSAAIAGDLILTADEVNPVIRALNDHGIAVMAIHSHMLKEEPRLFFMHFWANDDSYKLATGMRAALDLINISR